MARANLHDDMVSAMVDVVLKRMDAAVKSLRCDTSAVAPEHVVGFEAGYKQAKRQILELLGESI